MARCVVRPLNRDDCHGSVDTLVGRTRAIQHAPMCLKHRALLKERRMRNQLCNSRAEDKTPGKMLQGVVPKSPHNRQGTAS